MDLIAVQITVRRMWKRKEKRIKQEFLLYNVGVFCQTGDVHLSRTNRVLFNI